MEIPYRIIESHVFNVVNMAFFLFSILSGSIAVWFFVRRKIVSEENTLERLIKERSSILESIARSERERRRLTEQKLSMESYLPEFILTDKSGESSLRWIHKMSNSASEIVFIRANDLTIEHGSTAGRANLSEALILVTIANRLNPTLQKCKELESLILLNWTRILSAKGEAISPNKILRKIHENVGLSRANLSILMEKANHYDSIGKFNLVEILYHRIWTICRQRFGLHNENTLASCNNLVKLYINMNRYDEAEQILSTALSAYEENANTTSYAVMLGNQASINQRKKKYKEAEEYFNKSLSVHELQSGKNHPITAMTKVDLATLLMSQNRYSEAEPLLLTALETYRMHPDCHSYIGSVTDTLGTLYAAQNRKTRARDLLDESLNLRNSKYGDLHMDTILTWNKLQKLGK